MEQNHVVLEDSQDMVELNQQEPINGNSQMDLLYVLHNDQEVEMMETPGRLVCVRKAPQVLSLSKKLVVKQEKGPLGKQTGKNR